MVATTSLQLRITREAHDDWYLAESEPLYCRRCGRVLEKLSVPARTIAFLSAAGFAGIVCQGEIACKNCRARVLFTVALVDVLAERRIE